MLKKRKQKGVLSPIGSQEQIVKERGSDSATSLSRSFRKFSREFQNVVLVRLPALMMMRVSLSHGQHHFG